MASSFFGFSSSAPVFDTQKLIINTDVPVCVRILSYLRPLTMLLKRIDYHNINPYIKSNKQYAVHKRPQWTF